MRPLPFVWPWALLYWSVHLWAFWPEFRIVRTARREATEQDAKSTRTLTLGMFAGYIVAYLLAGVASLQWQSYRVAIFLAGIALIVAGSLLRRHCWRMLGASFTGDVRAHAGQQVINRGAYALVRHPSYTAGTLMNVGIGVALGSWASTLVLLIASLAVYLHRIAVEERTLLAVIGEPYARFLRTRKRLVPFVY